MFNDTFTMCIFTAIVLCEWYQAADHNDLLEYRVYLLEMGSEMCLLRSYLCQFPLFLQDS